MTNKPRKFGLIGKSLDHSFSKPYFEEKFTSQGISATYENFPIDSIERVKELLNSDYEGFNITIPYKEAIIPYLDHLSPAAQEIGAVNTIKRVGAEWYGFNTDWYGFKQMIKPFFKSHHERGMILGTGGASKAVAYVLEELGVNLIYISRDGAGEKVFSYGDLNDNMIRFNGIIVNTTPVGTAPDVDQCPELPYEFLDERHLAVDLIYNPEETLFLKKSRLQGATTLNGLTMLHQQAEETWKIWNRNENK